eukprot:m.455982 g.455982  ORF g.455982 m.455982 type:complete len:114 (-) comp20969_c0_seq1:62-403(-)
MGGEFPAVWSQLPPSCDGPLVHPGDSEGGVGRWAPYPRTRHPEDQNDQVKGGQILQVHVAASQPRPSCSHLPRGQREHLLLICTSHLLADFTAVRLEGLTTTICEKETLFFLC